MPRIEIEVRQVGTSKTWKEAYVYESGSSAQEWAQGTIDYFNATLRPGEQARELVGVVLLSEEEGPRKHHWTKTNLVTIVRGSSLYDQMKCERCGITGKRHGLSGVRRDSKYKAKKYEQCTIEEV